MAGRRNFRELEAKMSPERLARSNARVTTMLEEMLLNELRKLTGMTQTQLARELDVTQPTIAQMEQQDDMQISTLRRIIEALGGELEIVAKFPHARIAITQFNKNRSPDAA